jgi:ABC-type dipeptide/oligopeptide/nickel transport system permease subunit
LPDDTIPQTAGVDLQADDVTSPGLPRQSGILPPDHPTDREFTVRVRTQREIIFRRFLQHRLAVVSLVVLVLVALLGFVGAMIWHYKVTSGFSNDIQLGPSAKHPFGTDNNGYDYFAFVLRGIQRSMEIAFLVAAVGTLVGATYGAIAGYYRGWADTLMMRFVDLILTVPVIAIGALLAHKFGQAAGGWLPLSLVLAGVLWPGPARVVRAQVLSLREKEFVEAARALGARDRRIIFRHILPNVAGPIIVVVTLMVAGAILAETGLSFLGFGVHAPDTSLGLLISQNQTELDGGHWWLFLFPGIFIVLIALTINFIGDGLRDAFDPTQTRVRA